MSSRAWPYFHNGIVKNYTLGKCIHLIQVLGNFQIFSHMARLSARQVSCYCPAVSPKFCKTRTIPYACESKIDKELNILYWSPIFFLSPYFIILSLYYCPISHATLWAWFNITKLLANLLTKPSAFLLLCQLYCNLVSIKCIIIVL